MTFGGAIYTTVLAALGIRIRSSSLYTNLYLTQYSCLKPSRYIYSDAFKTGIQRDKYRKGVNTIIPPH